MYRPSIISIDGPAGSGKSTLGKRLSEYLGYTYFDTGVMYRALTLLALELGIDLNDEKLLADLAGRSAIDVRPASVEDGRTCDIYINGQDRTWAIRQSDVDAHVSVVSAYPLVRKILSKKQREIGLRGNIVMAGRDIGTVVLPEADLKIYLDASVEERAKRRYQELISRGERVDFDQVLLGVRERDRIDSTRITAPLKPAPDAVILVTDGLSPDESFRILKEVVEGHCE